MAPSQAYDAKARLAGAFARARSAAIPIEKFAADVGAELPSTSPDPQYVEQRLRAYQEANNVLDR